MKNRLLAVLLILPGITAFAQYNFKPVDQWLEKNVPLMGGRAILMVYKDGKIIYNHSEGTLNMRQKIVARMAQRRTGATTEQGRFDPGTKIGIASCSKWLSAALVMTFVDEGKLRLDDTVGRFLPVLSKNGKGSITLSQCLSHTTGIKAADLKESIQEMRDIGSMDEAITQIAHLPVEGPPGTIFRYSNVGLQIAGAVIEKIGAKSFEQLFSERIAIPLKMKNTDFGKGKVALPAGGAKSTPEDYMNFLVMILHKGVFNGKRFLSEKSIAAMQVNRINADVKVAYSPVEAGNFGYGFGEWVMGPDTFTSPGLFGSFPVVDYKTGTAAFLMTYYLKNDGRNERYKELMGLLSDAVTN